MNSPPGTRRNGGPHEATRLLQWQRNMYVYIYIHRTIASLRAAQNLGSSCRLDLVHLLIEFLGILPDGCDFRPKLCKDSVRFRCFNKVFTKKLVHPSLCETESSCSSGPSPSKSSRPPVADSAGRFFFTMAPMEDEQVGFCRRFWMVFGGFIHASRWKCNRKSSRANPGF